MNIRAFQPADEDAVIELWRACGLVAPQNDPRADIRRKLAVAPEQVLVGTLDGAIVATVMVGYEGHRGWINYLAVAPHLRGHGHGRTLMARAEEMLRALGCPKINLQVRSTNAAVLAFYRQIGFATDDVVSLGKRLAHDAPPDDARPASP